MPALDILLARILPLLPLLFSSNALCISVEWECHLGPLATLNNPIAPKAISEIFRRSYRNGAWTFLASLMSSIASSVYMWYCLELINTSGVNWYTSAVQSQISLRQAHHHLLPLGANSLRQSLFLTTAILGIVHLFPFGPIILPHVFKASDPGGILKHEKDVKEALRKWNKVNRVRVWVDVAAVICAMAALVVD